MAYYPRIRNLREDSDKTQSELASLLKTTAQYYGKYESGEREIPLSRAIELADYYSVSLDYLSGRTNNKKSIASGTELEYDELKLLQSFRNLSERNKGKTELFIEQLMNNQVTEKEAKEKET